MSLYYDSLQFCIDMLPELTVKILEHLAELGNTYLQLSLINTKFFQNIFGTHVYTFFLHHVTPKR